MSRRRRRLKQARRYVRRAMDFLRNDGEEAVIVERLREQGRVIDALLGPDPELAASNATEEGADEDASRRQIRERSARATQSGIAKLVRRRAAATEEGAAK